MLVWGRGSVALPFQGGVLCIDAPRQRTLLQDSGGNVGVEDCSGTFAFEFSPSYMATYSIGIGDQIFAQYWSRDPYSTPYPISLTDGLHFWICP
jgi:hypothetical protein